MNVLVVDADADARDLYRRRLATSGLHVHEAADGRDALVQIHSVKPQVVVLDDRLRYIDGLELCRLLREDATTASLRIIAITSDGSPDNLRRFREGGADAVFVKPVPFEDLASAIRGLGALPAPSAPVEEGKNPASTDAVRAERPRTVARARVHERYVSTDPPQPPPNLRCPHCDAVLHYDRSHVGGVSERHAEQWDYFVCAIHGAFQYRHRTRKLRPAS